MQLIHKASKDGGIRAAVSNVLPPSSKVEYKPNLIFYSIEEGGDIPDGIPSWVRELILSSDEFQEKTASASVEPPTEAEMLEILKEEDDYILF